MADKKISQLDPVISQANTDIYEISANDTGSFKETRLQMFSYNKNTIKHVSASTHNTTATLTAAEIVGGIIRSTATTGGVTLTLPPASDIYTAMSSPPVGTYQDCIFENLSVYPLTLASTDVNLIATGFVSNVILPKQTVSIRFTASNLSPVQITIDGGQFTRNNCSTSVYVNGINGLDIPGNGSYENPYKNVSYAQSQITDSSSTKVYTIILTSNVNDIGQIYLHPNINIIGQSLVFLSSAVPMIAHPTWGTVLCDFVTVRNLFLYCEVSLDFSTYVTSAIIYFNDIYFASNVTFNGVDGSPLADTHFVVTNCDFTQISDLSIDNCDFISKYNKYYPLTIGGGSATSGNSFYSFCDWFQNSFIYKVSNSNAADVCLLDLNSSLIGTPQTDLGGTNVVLYSSTVVSPKISIQSCNINRPIVLQAAGGMTGNVNALIAGCNKFPELFYSDETGSGTHIFLTIDSFSYPNFFTVVNGTPQVTTSTKAPTTWLGNQTYMGNTLFTGSNSFTGLSTLKSAIVGEIRNILISGYIPDSITATTATLNVAQTLGGTLTLNPVLAQTITTPTAAQIDTAIASIAGISMLDVNRGFSLKLVNQSSLASTLVGGTNVTTNGCYLTAGNVVIPALSQRDFTFVKTSNSPQTYTIFG